MISRISRNAVKEGFDTLPAAICYFDRNGLLRLINHRMQEIAAVLCGRDLQTFTDLEQALRSPGGGVRLRDEAARIYAFPDGTVYHFTVRPVQDKYGIPYTEVMATDVTQLAALHTALQQENERLADANRRAKRLYDNMPDIVREEEILKMKMRVHDDIGHTLLAARRALRHEHDLARIKSEAAKWESSISLLCRTRQENAAEDPLSYMQRRAAVLGAAVQLRGVYPAARATRELYALILRECTSNAVRHAGATELYADSEHRPQEWHLCITNNGDYVCDDVLACVQADDLAGHAVGHHYLVEYGAGLLHGAEHVARDDSVARLCDGDEVPLLLAVERGNVGAAGDGVAGDGAHLGQGALDSVIDIVEHTRAKLNGHWHTGSFNDGAGAKAGGLFINLN